MNEVKKFVNREFGGQELTFDNEHGVLNVDRQWKLEVDINVGLPMKRYFDAIPFQVTQHFIPSDKIGNIEVKHDQDTLLVSVIQNHEWGQTHRVDESYAVDRLENISPECPVMTIYATCSSNSDECKN
jgi:hypothetical protein